MENQNKFKALDIDFSIPDELQSSIDKYIDYLNTETNSKYLLEDCYQTEILMEINECIREDLLDPDNIALLKNYYIKGGIHNIKDTKEDYDDIDI